MEKHILCNGDSKTHGRCTNASEEIVTATEADLPRILEIYDIAKAYMRANGNPNQWNGAYPDPETLRTDIEKQRLYVYKKAGSIHGVFMLLLEEEPTYAYIEDGSWREETPYGTIHRLARRLTHRPARCLIHRLVCRLLRLYAKPAAAFQGHDPDRCR